MLHALFLAWSLWVAFGLPVSLAKKIRLALRDLGRPPAWRAGRVMFFCGILVWCPYVGLRNLAGYRLPLPPVLAAHLALLYGGLALQRIAGKKEAPPRAAGPP